MSTAEVIILGENSENVALDREDDDPKQQQPVLLTLDDYRRILRELDQNRDLQNRRREKLSQVSQRRNLRKKRASDANQETSTRSSSCYLCNIRVALEDITTYAICRGCDRTVCRGRRCSDWDRTTGYWECVSCIRNRDSQIRAGEWILDQLNQRFKSPRSDASREDLAFKDAETQSERSFMGSPHSISLEQKEKVREFLEDIIASMIGGPLDNVPVNQMHRHPSYLPLHEHECPGVAHVNLKRLIQKVIEEALNLPDLFDFSGYPPRPESHLPYFSTKKYEQLLATAVLNKVIDHYRNPKNHPENSSGIQSGSELDSNHNALTDKTSLLSPSASVSGQKALDKRLEEASQTSDSSLKTRSTESDETYLSDYIQSHRVPLPDLSAASSEGTADDNSSEILSTAGTEGTWEENWLFKKRKVKSDTNSTAIGMLVPSPTEEVKALIGDKNVDEVSDLSEAGSDAEDDSPATKLIESKTIIGGKNDLISLEETSSATDSLLSNPDSGINVTEARNEVLLIDGDFTESTTEGVNPAQAFNEKVGSIVNGTEAAPIPTPRQTTPATERVEKLEITQNHVVKHSDAAEVKSDTPEPDSLEDEHLIPGSIAEREHLKWQHPDTDMPNNPYSPEALQQRLVGLSTPKSQTAAANIESPKTPERSLQVVLGENSPDHKRYGRDYYINDAKNSSGTRKKQLPPPSEDFPSRSSEEDKSGLFMATPIQAVDENSGTTSENVSLQLTDSLTPSEDSDTTRIYEIETRETRLLRHSVIVSAKKPVGSSDDTTKTPPSTPTEEEGGQQAPVFTLPTFQEKEQPRQQEEEKNDEALRKKTISPNTVKFFAPKKPPVFVPTTPTPTSASPAAEASPFLNGTTTTTATAVEKKKEINNNDVLNKIVIEEEILPTLPSVKKLMSAFSASNPQPDDTKKPVSSTRPKTLPLQADQEPATKGGESEKKKHSPTNGKSSSGNPSAMVPGYSITARSLSKQFRDELKHSTSQEDETVPEVKKNDVEKEEKGKRHSSPERPPSPVLTPGRLKSNIAFFENLRNNTKN